MIQQYEFDGSIDTCGMPNDTNAVVFGTERNLMTIVYLKEQKFRNINNNFIVNRSFIELFLFGSSGL